MDCRQALISSKQDMQGAIDWLKEKGKLTASKLANRQAAEGVISFAVGNGKGVLVELNSETDFVSRLESFRGVSHKIAMASLKSPIPKNKIDSISVDDINKLKVEVEGDEGKPAENLPISDALTRLISKVKENMKVRRVLGIMLEENKGVVGGYVHGEGDKRVGRFGALVALETNKPSPDLVTLANQLAMHIVGYNPLYITKDQVPEAVIQQKLEVQKKGQGLSHVIEDLVLLEQPFFAGSDSETVAQHLANESQRLGADIKIHSYVRIGVGDGVEKIEVDFVQQVMDLINAKK